MASTYKTPGVYIEEISKFPPSVAQVETAIPAFIGYTELAKEKSEDTTDTLIMTPFRITSMLEYEQHFGFAQEETGIGITLTETGGEKSISVSVPEEDEKSPFLMYYAMQMYFANGGGPCYIVSVSNYTDALAANSVDPVQLGDLTDGLDTLEKEDEPTLLLFPDAINLSNANDFYSLYNDALAQCQKLQDRFTIIDTYTDDEDVEMNDATGVRALISNNLEEKKYGAVYFPYVNTILDYAYDEASLVITHNSDLAPTWAADSSDLASAIAAAQTSYATQVTDFGALNTTIQAASAADAFDDVDDVIEAAQEIVDTLSGISENVLTIVTATSVAANQSSENPTVADAATAAGTALNDEVTDGSDFATAIASIETQIDALEAAGSGTPVKTASAAINTAFTSPNDISALIDAIEALIPAATTALTNAAGVDSDAGELDGLTMGAIKDVDSVTYNNIKTAIQNMALQLPPSSTMAGVYARVDASRGVWKAPANVSVNYVIKPSIKITNDIQDRLNVDTTAGKSINAIRSFVGKGTLVWGSRTLAGNDNEWRYVPVRRFFNMAEESIKKATEQFVFEPNDANTWTKVRAMITNFLTLQWKAGALAGPTAESAFYVNIGLGETMTALDILEGRMIVEIGMAVVRPAEFIILKFSHKMQEA